MKFDVGGIVNNDGANINSLGAAGPLQAFCTMPRTPPVLSVNEPGTQAIDTLPDGRCDLPLSLSTNGRLQTSHVSVTGRVCRGGRTLADMVFRCPPVRFLLQRPPKIAQHT
jgi:hypothetical protein